MIDLKALTEVVGQLEEEAMLKMLKDFTAGNPSEEEAQAVIAACQQGMSIVGDLFEANEYFVGDLIFAGGMLTQAIDILKPYISSKGSAKKGKIVLGTVEGDLHDIGKNIFSGMAEAAGFEVYDLGIDQTPGAFVEKVKEVKADIVGLSGVLTLALDSMENTVQALKDAGLRSGLKIIIGGNPVSADACRQIGADAFTINAAEGIKICEGWVR
jgi:methylmalonyl-CoA mutase cobalamin-binding domain/chain